MSAQVDHPRLLPAVLVPDRAEDAGPLRRTTRDWLVDVAVFLLAIGFGFVAYADREATGPPMPEAQWLADAAAGLVACLALWVRRRWPLGVALALVPLGAFSTFAAGAVSIALFSLAVHRRFGVVAPVAILSLLTLPVYLEVHDDPETPYWSLVALSVAITVAVVAWGMFVRSRRQLVLTLHDRAERAEAEQELRVEQARAHERARIAREMHDVLAHRISLLSLHAGALEFRHDASAEEVSRAAGVIRSSAHQALEDLREVIGVLREGADGDAPDRPQPTLVDLPELIDESRAAGMHVTATVALGDLTAVPTASGRNAYRIVQEALTNARKHAHGSAVDVAVGGVAGEGLAVEVRNRLPLGQVAVGEIPGSGTGIVGLAERASLAGGRLEHGPTADGDFRIWAWLPWAPPA